MKSRLITRRNAIITGLAGVGGLALTGLPKDLPPTYGHLLRMGDNLTYLVHRGLLLPGQSLVPEYALPDITSFPATGTIVPSALLTTVYSGIAWKCNQTIGAVAAPHAAETATTSASIRGSGYPSSRRSSRATATKIAATAANES